MFNFIDEFYCIINKDGKSWKIQGLLDENGMLHCIGNDTKLIGRIFEILVDPYIRKLANLKQYEVEVPLQQNYYPDFTLTKYNKDGSIADRIAVDIKTTYRNKNGSMKFTLGSFASYIRNNNKNIVYPYNTYNKHYVVGFVYDRVDNISSDNTCPYDNVDFFVEEKYKIASDTTGSGNTENIGSIICNSIEDFTNSEKIIFQSEAEFVDYWKGFPRYKSSVCNYRNINEYYDFKKK